MIRTTLLTAMLSLIVGVGAAAGPAGPVFQGDPQAIAEIQAAFQKFFTAHTWRARLATPGSGGTAGGVQTMDHVAPDKFHMTFSQGGQTSDMFVIGSDAWMRAGGTCQKLPGARPMVNPRQAMEQRSDARITVTRGGAETVDGAPTQTYFLMVEAQGNQAKEKLFVATGTGLPRRVEIPSNEGTIVIDYFDYDAPITISNPPC